MAPCYIIGFPYTDSAFMKHFNYIISISALIVAIALSSFASETDPYFTDWVEPEWGNPLEDIEGQVRIVDIADIAEVQVSYAYPNGKQGKLVCSPDEDDDSLFHFTIPFEVEAGLGEMSYRIEVSHGPQGTDHVSSQGRRIAMGYEEDLDITANPPEILWFELGDKSATVRYTACCNILGASIIAIRTPVNPMESSKGLPASRYSDFVWLEPDALSASTAGLYFEFGFNPADFKSDQRRIPVLYEYTWLTKDWAPVLTFKLVDGDTIDFPATEGGIYVLAKE